tara:strand:+ start:218 stop:487 length:270 start_codon:yes stop_codon:yes gene_type:complete
MPKDTMEKVWKVFTVVLGVVVVPLAGWVWNTNVAVAQIQNDLVDAEGTIVVLEQKVEEADANAKAIISMEKDIEYMKQTLDRIERLVAE